jgi:preprotein translocase subunit SecG
MMMMMMMVVVVVVVVVVVKAAGRHTTYTAGLGEFFKKKGKASKCMDSTLKL